MKTVLRPLCLLRASRGEKFGKSLLYLVLTFPLGVIHYSLFSALFGTGRGLDPGLSIVIWLPICAVALLMGWFLVMMERELAIQLLEAQVPPLGPPPFGAIQGRLRFDPAFLLTQGTWTGIVYLLLKYPLGITTFKVLVYLVTPVMASIKMLLLYPAGFIEWRGAALWRVDTPAEVGLCLLAGSLSVVLSLYVLNVIVALWRRLSTVMLGSPSPNAEPASPSGAVQIR